MEELGVYLPFLGKLLNNPCMELIKYELRAFSSALLEETKTIWLTDLEKSENVFPPDFHRVLLSTSQNMNYELRTVLQTYGLFEDGSNVADALVDIQHSPTNKKMVKMLKCVLRPSIHEVYENPDFDSLRKITSIFLAAVFGTIDVGMAGDNLDEIRLYGRHSMLLSLLKIVEETLKKTAYSSVYNIDLKKNWLIMAPK